MKQLYFSDVIMPDESILQLIVKGYMSELKNSCVIGIQDWKYSSDMCEQLLRGKSAVVYNVHQEGQRFVINAEKLAGLTGVDENYWEDVLSMLVEKYEDDSVRLYDEIVKELRAFKEVAGNA